jgi:hypothetical protein
MSNDAKILRLVGQALEREGALVQLLTLEEARPIWKKAEMIFSMCQGPNAVAEIAEWKKQGAFIINDPEASRRTYRDSLCSAIREKDLGFPHSFFVSTEDHTDTQGCLPLFAQGGAWLKRADVHATQAGDVVFLPTYEDLPLALSKFRSRGLATAVLQSHCGGDEVKFYAVQGGRFFWPFYPKDSEGYPFDEKKLHQLAEHAATALGISIYGGDAIISPEGRITLIDLNDWPSFAPCRGAAAHAIASYLKDRYYAAQNKRETSKV